MFRTSVIAFSVLGVLLLTILGACAHDIGHRNFRNWMQTQVGRSVWHMDYFGVRYPQAKIGSRDLPNGNREDQFRVAQGECRVFFEVNPKENRVVAWRFTGSEADCSIRP
jgi:hypothetical protein